jgi:hypothetical protein
MDYLRARVRYADRVVRVARQVPDASLDLVYAIEAYSSFLGFRPEPIAANG